MPMTGNFMHTCEVDVFQGVYSMVCLYGYFSVSIRHRDSSMWLLKIIAKLQRTKLNKLEEGTVKNYYFCEQTSGLLETVERLLRLRTQCELLCTAWNLLVVVLLYCSVVRVFKSTQS